MKSQHSLKKSPVKAPAERVGKDSRRQTRRHVSAEDKIRIVLDGLRGEDSIAELCRKEGIAQSLYYTCDVTPNFHPVAIKASASLLRGCAGEARGCVA